MPVDFIPTAPSLPQSTYTNVPYWQVCQTVPSALLKMQGQVLCVAGVLPPPFLSVQ